VAEPDELVGSMPFARLLGLRVTQATVARVCGEILVRPELCTAHGVMHGGALMALADSLGAIGALMTLPEGARGTATIESKTNFLLPAAEGTMLNAEATPVSTGQRISVWQTRITRSDGRAVALVTQTQLVLWPGRDAGEA
jgi:1,4-dihydroxy-2-naphthoyl-CoA hydrolase